MLWTVLAAGSPAARQQEPRAFPDVTGTYEGPEVRHTVCPEGAIDDPTPAFLVITQQGQSFSGSLDFGEAILTGNVDTNGSLTGTYSINLEGLTGGGTFTGQLSGDQIQLTLTGTLTAVSAGETCTETFTLTVTRSATAGPKADLSITGMVSPSPVASGARIIYALNVTNAGPDDAPNVLVTQPTPAGTTFASATSSQGKVQSPAPGGQGNVIYSLGTMVKGATATVSLTGNVLAPTGSTLVDSPFVTSNQVDVNLANNSITISTPVVASTTNTVVTFAAFPTRRAPKPKNNPCSSFTVENFGLTPMVLTLDSIVRTGSDVDSGRITDANDTRFFSLSLVNSDQSLTPLDVGAALTLQSGQFQSVCAKFAALIPALAGKTTGLAAGSVLPNALSSKIVFRQNGGANISIPIQSRVSTGLVLVNLVNPRNPPEVTFVRNGDDITVSYAVFDSNLDVSRAKYEFLDSNGQVVAGPLEIDLVAPVQTANLIKGQSFSVEQRFNGASSTPQATAVRLTVFDGETSVSTSSSGSQASISAASIGLLNRAERVTLYLPDVRLSPRVP